MPDSAGKPCVFHHINDQPGDKKPEKTGHENPRNQQPEKPDLSMIESQSKHLGQLFYRHAEPSKGSAAAQTFLRCSRLQ